MKKTTELPMIVCDKCKTESSPQDIKIERKVIGTDEEDDEVEEQFFTCPHCKQKYVFLVTDRKMRLMIQKRGQLLHKIARGRQNRAPEVLFHKWIAEDTALKNELLERSKKLKETWKNEL